VSERTARLDELLRQEISSVITREVHDPRVGFVTVTDVEVAADLRHANVWVSIIGGDDERRETMRVLGRAMPYVRHHLGSLRLRRIPELHLKEDRTAERGTRVLRILDELESGASAGEAEAAGVQETLPTPLGRVPVEPRRPRRRTAAAGRGGGPERRSGKPRRGERPR
jgi:ribosome-binding factor A